jgi:diguanylate cyclase (GGDEF)-like protein/PAS domain S-box-containing protein
VEGHGTQDAPESPDGLELNGWHGATNRVRQLQIAQAAILGIVCAVSLVLIGVLGRGMLDAGEDQRRAAERLNTLAEIRDTMRNVQVGVWQGRAQGKTGLDPSVLTSYADFRRKILSLPSDPDESPAMAAARAEVREGIARTDRVISRVAANPDDPAIVARALRDTDEPTRLFTSGMDEWVDATAVMAADASASSERLSKRLLAWLFGIVAALGAVGVATWFTLDRARTRLVRSLQDSEERFRSLVQNSSDLVLIVEPAGVIRYASQPARQIVGYAPRELVGRHLSELVHASEDGPMGLLDMHGVEILATVEPIEWLARHHDGSARSIESLVTDRRDDPFIGGFVVNSRDVTERREMQEALTHRAFHDALTDLANRALFEDRVRHALSLRERAGGLVAVLVIDLDDFKTINDSLGHGAGDALLIDVASRLRQSLRVSDTAARLGGDEFAILLETASSTREILGLADRIVALLHEPVTIGGREIVVHGSIGIAVADDDTTTADDMLRDADVAMYAAKDRGRGGYALFESSMTERATDRLTMIADLRRVVERDQLSVVYQPIVDLTSEAIIGVEALLRWNHPERGEIPPDTFIPIAEEMGAIHEIGDWVLHQAVRQVAECARTIPQSEGLQLSVNLSPRQLEKASIVETVGRVLAEEGLPPHRLTLEITETALMRDPDAALGRLQQLRALGVRLAVDDFGTGYSSLAYLSRLPIDQVKIDRSFVAGLREGRRDARLTSMIVGIGDSLNLTTVAEGVEVLTQVEHLRQLGCGMAQGFHFARPLAADALVERLRGAAPDPAAASLRF